MLSDFQVAIQILLHPPLTRHSTNSLEGVLFLPLSSCTSIARSLSPLIFCPLQAHQLCGKKPGSKEGICRMDGCAAVRGYSLVVIPLERILYCSHVTMTCMVHGTSSWVRRPLKIQRMVPITTRSSSVLFTVLRHQAAPLKRVFRQQRYMLIVTGRRGGWLAHRNKGTISTFCILALHLFSPACAVPIPILNYGIGIHVM